MREEVSRKTQKRKRSTNRKSRSLSREKVKRHRHRSPSLSSQSSFSSSNSPKIAKNRRILSSSSESKSRSSSEESSRLDNRERSPRGSSGYGLSSDRRPRGPTETKVPKPKSKIDFRKIALSKDDSDESDSSVFSLEKFDNPGDVHLNDEVLALLGEDKSLNNDPSGKVHNSLTKNWSNILKSGMAKDVTDDIVKKYPVPDEFPALKSPVLNPEVKSTMTERSRKKDDYQSKTQTKIGAAIYATGLALTTIFNQGRDMDTSLISYLSDAARLLSDVHYNISITRRAFITPNINRLVEDITTDQPIDSLLFGEKLSERLKAAKQVEKESKALTKVPQSSTNSSFRKNTADKYFPRTQNYSNANKYPGHFSQPRKNLNFKGPSRGNRSNFRSRQDGQNIRHQKTKTRR